jgi:hypothetical protein
VVWQPVDRLVEGLHDVVGDPRSGTCSVSRHFRQMSFGRTPPTGCNFDANRGPTSDPMKPRSQRLPYPERATLACQDEERRLKGVLGIVIVTDDPKAGAQHHGTMPLDQGREGDLGSLAAPAGKLLQELTVSQSGNDPHVEQGVEMVQDSLARSIFHSSASLATPSVSPIKAAQKAKGSHFLGDRSEISSFLSRVDSTE